MIQLLQKTYAFFNKFLNTCGVTSNGIAVLETVITFPVFMMLVFFMLEAIKVYWTKAAIESIAAEATFVFVEDKNTDRFAGVIEKYRPPFIAAEHITWYFSIYEDMDTMCNTLPYGAEDIYWYSTENSNTILDANTTNNSDPDADTNPSMTAGTYLRSGDSSFVRRAGHLTDVDDQHPEITLAKSQLVGKAFVLTFVCDYQFSSGYAKMIYGGGANTVDKTKYLLWGRGCGICNND